MNDLTTYLNCAKRIINKWYSLCDEAKEYYYMNGTYSLIDEDDETVKLIDSLPKNRQTLACELILNALNSEMISYL